VQLEQHYLLALRHMWIAIVGLYVCAIVGGLLLWKAYGDIQESRNDYFYTECEDINRRHDNSVRQLHKEIERLPPEDRKAAKASIEANIRLIDKLVPVHQDANGKSTCRQIANDQTGTDDNP
jgi:hypothetical protein